MIAIILALIGGPPVEASLLDGRRIAGTLKEVSAERVLVEAKTGQVAVSRADLLRLDFGPTAASKSPMVVRLADGSRFGATSFESDGRTTTAAAATGVISFPVEQLAGVLLVADPHEAADFQGRAAEKRRTDRIVLAREGKRLVLDGIVGKVGSEKIEFTVDGDLLPINRSRVKALYLASKGPPPRAAAMITDRRGDLWAAAEWRWQAGAALKTPSGVAVTVPLESLASIDLTADRVAYLSDLEPAIMQHTPGFDQAWPPRRDRGPAGGRIEIDGEAFVKGLVLHSRTVAEYALDGRYRRFQAVVGVPTGAGPLGDAEVRVAADGKVVWRRRVRAGDKGQPLDLEVANVKSLRLEVDFGRNLDAGDHVAFADAKVLK